MLSMEMDNIVRALQCEDPNCACRRNGTRKHPLHCPAHADRTPSLSLTERGGKLLFYCFAGCTQDAIIKALKQKRLIGGGIDPPVGGVTALHALQGAAGLALQALADAKQLPVDELRSYGLSDTKHSGVPAVRIPYADGQGDVVAVRFRRSLMGEPRFVWRRGDKVTPYGQDFGDARRAGWTMIVEGESDCWTLWHYGLPAVGIPGKSTWRAEWARFFDGLEVFLWCEPDAAELPLRIGRDIPHLQVIHAPEGAKDPSALHVLGRDVKGEIERLRANAVPVAILRQAAADAQLAAVTQQAEPVLHAADPLELVAAEVRGRGYGGDIRPIKIVYLAATSRVLAMRQGAMPVHLLLLGSPSSGKTYTMQSVLGLLPPEAQHTIDAGSPRVLIYDDAELAHKVLVFGEADSLPAGEDNPAASAVRGLLQDNCLHYMTTVRDPETGGFTVHEVNKPGPTVLLTTAVQRLGEQLMTRLFTLELADDPAQIGAALRTQAGIELGAPRGPEAGLVAFQAYLQARAPWDVIVPFADRLADIIAGHASAPGAGARRTGVPRILRDFSRLLALIKSAAVLRHRQRRTNADGRLVAEIEDYETVRELVGDMYKASVSDGASEKVRAAVEAVAQLHAEKASTETVSQTRVGQALGISKPAAARRLKTAIANGWVINTEQRKNQPWNLEPGEPLPEISGLPLASELAENNEALPAPVGDDLAKPQRQPNGPAQTTPGAGPAGAATARPGEGGEPSRHAAPARAETLRMLPDWCDDYIVEHRLRAMGATPGVGDGQPALFMVEEDEEEEDVE